MAGSGRIVSGRCSYEIQHNYLATLHYASTLLVLAMALEDATLQFVVLLTGYSGQFVKQCAVAVQVKLVELKVGRNNAKEKGIIEETKKLKATTLVIGSSSRTIFGM